MLNRLGEAIRLIFDGSGLRAERDASVTRDTPAERGRGETEHQFHVLVETVTDYAIYMLDAGGHVTTWNPGAERAKGYTADQIIGQNFARFYTEEDQRAGIPRKNLKDAAEHGRWEVEGWRVRSDGRRFWANVIIYPVKDEAGKLSGYVKITRDVTERLQHEEAVQRAQAAAIQSQKIEAVGQLTGGIAHDFNNLLTSILGTADLLNRRTDISKEVKALLGVVISAAERGASLTQRLLAFSRRQALAPREVDINRLIGGMSELLRRTLGESIVIEVVQAGGLWRTLADPNQLENALLNLAINARDAMPEGGKLTLETGNTYLDEDYAAAHAEVRAGQYVLLAVTDTGSGMAPEVIERAFEPFYTTKPEGQGTGLGLSQVFGFLKQSEGHVKIYSEVGEGTTVKIYLPRFVGALRGEETPSRSDVSILAKGEEILMVEDDADVREFTGLALHSLGYRVFEAADAASALEIVTQQPNLALLFTDVGLPGMNGRRLAEAARQERPALKVLYTTGYARNAIVHHGLLDAGVDLLPKPFTIEMMGRKLREILGG